MDANNHTSIKRTPECILSYTEPPSPDILIQTKKTVVYLNTFTPISSSLSNNPVCSDYETDSSSYDIESEEEDPLMVKPLPARGIPPAKPTMLSQNYIKKYLNTKNDRHSYDLKLKEEFKRNENIKIEIVENFKKSDTSPCLNTEYMKTESTLKGCNKSPEVHLNDSNNKEISIKLEKCEKIVPGTNSKEKINVEIPNEFYSSMTSSPCHSPLSFDECLMPNNEIENEKLEIENQSKKEKKVHLKRDLLKLKEKKAYTCNRQDCSFVATSRKALYCHKREKHRHNRDFLCSVCPFRTSFASDLKKHFNTHVPVKMKCPYKDCDYVGKHSNSLDYHKRKVHPKGSPLHCSIPGCQFSTFLPSSLKVHQIKNHGSGKTISCDQCSYRCYLTAELRKHLRTHSSETPYACDFPNCQYACKISSNLRKHKRIHTEERPYACDVCLFRSNFISSLKAHKRIHTDERPYCCEQCGYRCNSASNLKKHIVQRHPGTVYEIRKDDGVLNKGRKKNDLVPQIITTTKCRTNIAPTGLAIEQSDTNQLVPTQTNVKPMHYSMPILQMDNKHLLFSQELYHCHRMQKKSLNS